VHLLDDDTQAVVEDGLFNHPRIIEFECVCPSGRKQ
jgi:hypothetical protein